MECEEPILTNWSSNYNIREEVAEVNANLCLTRVRGLDETSEHFWYIQNFVPFEKQITIQGNKLSYSW